jgi:hypothetical protein
MTALPNSLMRYPTMTPPRWKAMAEWCSRWRPPRPEDLADDPATWHRCHPTRNPDTSRWEPFTVLVAAFDECVVCGRADLPDPAHLAPLLVRRHGIEVVLDWLDRMAAGLDVEEADRAA